MPCQEDRLADLFDAHTAFIQRASASGRAAAATRDAPYVAYASLKRGHNNRFFVPILFKATTAICTLSNRTTT